MSEKQATKAYNVFLCSRFYLQPRHTVGSPVGQMVKDGPATRETWVGSLGWEDPLEGGMAACSSILAWRIPMDRGAWRPTVDEVAESQTGLSN